METFVGDTPKIILKTRIDLSSYDVLWIKFKRPDRTTGHWVATQSGTDVTWMEYQLVEVDLDMPGDWVLQAHAHDSIAPTAALHGKWVDLKVLSPLPETTTPPTTLAPTTLAP